MTSLVRRVPLLAVATVTLAVVTIPIVAFAPSSEPARAVTHSIDVRWPTEGATVSGTQAFKALLTGKTLEQYRMFWQVDEEKMSEMSDSHDDYAHKEATVDVTDWAGDGSHQVTFVAENKGGKRLAQRTVTITVIQSTDTSTPAASTTTTAAPTTTATTAAPTTTTTTIAPTTSAPSTTTTTPPTTTAAPAADITSVLAGATLYVDPGSPAKTQADVLRSDRPYEASLLDKIAGQSTAKWFGDWNGDIFAAVAQATDAITAAGAVPVYVAYNIPLRDCSGYSAGGSQSADEYRSWIRSFTKGVGSRSAAVILEPDALALLDCLSDDHRAERLALINDAVETMGVGANISVYIDAGHARWHSPREIAQRLDAAGIAGARGFSLNVSNFVTTEETVTYGEKVSAILGGKPFVVDTSRNGAGPASDGEWCNPPGRALGRPPTTSTGESSVDGYLWVKPPGESDGTCSGGPAAGEFWTDYAIGLAERAGW